MRMLISTHQRRHFSTGTLEFDPKINYYKILEIKESATPQDVKKAFYALAKKYHPDTVSHSAEEKTQNEEKFKQISNAYDVLSNENKKQQYDQMRTQFTSQSHQQRSYYNGQDHTYTYDSQGNKKYQYTHDNDSWSSEDFNRKRSDFENRFRDFTKDYSYYRGDSEYEHYQRNQKYRQEQYRMYEEQFYRDQKEFFRRQQQHQQQQQREHYYNNTTEQQRAEEAMQYALKSFLGFSLFTFLLFGLLSKDNKYKDNNNYRGNGWYSLCGESHLYQNTSQYTSPALQGRSKPQYKSQNPETDLALKVSQGLSTQGQPNAAAASIQ